MDSDHFVAALALEVEQTSEICSYDPVISHKIVGNSGDIKFEVK